MEGQFDQSEESLTSARSTTVHVYCQCIDACIGDKTGSEGRREGEVFIEIAFISPLERENSL